MALTTCVASVPEKRRPLAVDALIPDSIFTSTHAITIDARPEQVWPWIAQMGAGRAGWYSWDAIDNGGTPSAMRVVPTLQTVAAGDLMPAVPGATDAFVVAAIDPPRDLVLTAPDGRGGQAVAWEHLLEPLDDGRTRLIVRARASAGWLDLARAKPPAGRRFFIERMYGLLARLPRPLLIACAAFGHRFMEARHLRRIQRRSTAATRDRQSAERWRPALLACGILAALLHVAMTLFVGRLWDGYSAASQTISELSAIGAPTRSLWIWLGTVYTVLMFAFGWIVWKSALPNRAQRVVGVLLMTQAVLAYFWPPMHQRAELAAGGHTLTDTLHIAWTIVSGAFFTLTIGFGSAAFGRRFRVYSIVTIAIMLACGALTGTYASRIEADLPTPWVGVWERLSAAVYMLWIAVLATTILRASNPAAAARRRNASAHSSAFKSSAGQAAFFAAYDAVLTLWPVPCEEIDIPGRFGTTHVVVSGRKGAAPLVLLHGYMGTSVMWGPNIEDFTKDYRVYAIDTMGQPSKSIPNEPIRSAADYVAWLTETLDALHLDRICLAGMSFGGWLALTYTAAAPERIQKLVLLSPGGFLPIARQFVLRGLLMMFFPTRFTVNSFMRWAGFDDAPGKIDARPVLDLMYLGLKQFRMPPETLRVAASPLADAELRGLHVPVLLLMGEDEVLYDAATAMARARRLIPDFEGALIPRCRHDMCSSEYQIVDRRMLDFLRKTSTAQTSTAKASVA